jgi:flagellar hook-basal body complex protein FliE
MTPISPIQAPSPAAVSSPSPLPGKPTGEFQSLLGEAIDRVEQFRVNSEQAVNRFLSGEDDEIHHVALAAQQADLAFDLFLQVRNKVVAAYQEVMRMQV